MKSKHQQNNYTPTQKQDNEKKVTHVEQENVTAEQLIDLTYYKYKNDAEILYIRSDKQIKLNNNNTSTVNKKRSINTEYKENKNETK